MIETTKRIAIQERIAILFLWSGIQDLNLRPHRPERCALPNCANSRLKTECYFIMNCNFCQ